MPARSRFEYPPNNPNMYDPVLRLRVSRDAGRSASDWKNVSIGIWHDPAIEPGRWTMPQPAYSPEERAARASFGWDFSRELPFQSPQSQRLARVLCTAVDCADRIMLKVCADGDSLRSYHMRGSIERLQLPLISADVSSMYVGVFTAYPFLPALRAECLTSERFPTATAVDLCVTTSALTEGLGLAVRDFPMVEPPMPGAMRPRTPRSGSDTSPWFEHEGWHCLASAPLRLR